VRSNIIINKISLQSDNRTTISQVYKFSNKLWDFKSENLSESICEVLRSNLNIDEKMKRGLMNIEKSLEIYLEISNSSIKNYLLTIFGSIIIENGTIICTINKYHNKPWFSDVAIMMNSEEIFEYKTDKGLCYGQVIIFKIIKTT
jgi:hypothetical protein